MADLLAEHDVSAAFLESALFRPSETAIRQGTFPEWHDDDRLRDALRERGVGYYEKLQVLFRPSALEEFDDLRPVNQRGETMAKVDWYVGLCPSHPAYIDSVMERAEALVTRFAPEGLFVGMMRFPGFWGTWVPETRREDIDEYCFCDRCTTLFESWVGVPVRAVGAAARATIILREFRDEWTQWKCELIAGIFERLHQTVKRVSPAVKIHLNCPAIDRSMWDGVVLEVLGQDLRMLKQYADELAPQAYHQVLHRRLREWVPGVVTDMGPLGTTELMLALQLKASYLEQMYRHQRRDGEVTVDEVAEGLSLAEDLGAVGVELYTWDDWLDAELAGDHRLTDLFRRYREGARG